MTPILLRYQGFTAKPSKDENGTTNWLLWDCGMYLIGSLSIWIIDVRRKGTVVSRYFESCVFEGIKIALTQCWHIIKMVENVTVAKFGLAFTCHWYKLKMIENSMVKKFSAIS